MEKDKVQEEAGIETREEDDDESGTKRERESGEIEGGGGEPSRKKRDPEAVSRFKQRSAAWFAKLKEEFERKVAEHPDVDWSDSLAIDASSYRKDWDYVWSQAYGSFDKITPIPPMRYTTADPGPDYASEHDAVQIFCVKIRELRRGLQWPIHVFGLVAARDVIDHNRNIIFNRTRDDCQLLTQEVPYLLLTGPTRAVVVVDPVDFEVALKVKGSIESEDKDLSFLAVQLTRISNISGTHLINKEYTSKLSTLELTFGYIVRSVEATINVRVIDGSWPEEGFSARITAHTSSLKDYRVLLLDSGDEMKKMSVTADGMIELSRRVVSVEFEGELEVSVAAFGSNCNYMEAEEKFTPRTMVKARPSLMLAFFGGFNRIPMSHVRSASAAADAASDWQKVRAEWFARFKEEYERKVAEHPDVDWSDELAVDARHYRESWERIYARAYGPFDKSTSIPPMRYTAEPVPFDASEQYTLQIFCVKIKELRRGLQWPIHVFGLIAARDTIDHNRNMVFDRTRDDCQTLTQEDPYLLLTGPTRAVVVCDPVYLEAVLRVKGSTESEDEDLSFFTVPLTNVNRPRETCLITREYTSKLSTLELTFGYVVRSVEATIKARIVDGSWPEEDGSSARFTACTSSLKHNGVLLLDSGDKRRKMRVDADGVVGLSRRVVSVEFEGELEVSVVTFDGSNICSKMEAEIRFVPEEVGESCVELDVGFCKMEITVAWSCLSLSCR
uniref:DUF6598 domain-containing protein n=1 Tax=Oryza rufipogon TaxID=4529 RepID=A0A0E0R0M9_ORYRU